MEAYLDISAIVARILDLPANEWEQATNAAMDEVEGTKPDAVEELGSRLIFEIDRRRRYAESFIVKRWRNIGISLEISLDPAIQTVAFRIFQAQEIAKIVLVHPTIASELKDKYTNRIKDLEVRYTVLLDFDNIVKDPNAYIAKETASYPNNNTTGDSLQHVLGAMYSLYHHDFGNLVEQYPAYHVVPRAAWTTAWLQDAYKTAVKQGSQFPMAKYKKDQPKYLRLVETEKIHEDLKSGKYINPAFIAKMEPGKSTSSTATSKERPGEKGTPKKVSFALDNLSEDGDGLETDEDTEETQ